VTKTETDILRALENTPGCRQMPHFNTPGGALTQKYAFDAVTEPLRLEAEFGGKITITQSDEKYHSEE
jgi:hypothetical protein